MKERRRVEEEETKIGALTSETRINLRPYRRHPPQFSTRTPPLYVRVYTSLRSAPNFPGALLNSSSCTCCCTRLTTCRTSFSPCEAVEAALCEVRHPRVRGHSLKVFRSCRRVTTKLKLTSSRKNPVAS